MLPWIILLPGFTILFFPFTLPLRMDFNQFQRTSQLVLGGKALKISAGACVDFTICRKIGRYNLMQLCFKSSSGGLLLPKNKPGVV